LAAAEQEDEIARQIVQRAASDLADLVASVARRLDWGRNEGPLPVVLAGGVLCNSPLLRTVLAEAIAAANLGDARYHVVDEPVRGALQLASKLPNETPL
jgi:N-acetylglucosamine kinase-like BadF-type ATPase